MSNISENLQFLRINSKESQRQVSDNLMINYATWNDYERGKSKPSLDIICRISDYFQISTDDLLRKDLSNPSLTEKSKDKNIDKKPSLIPSLTPSLIPEKEVLSGTPIVSIEELVRVPLVEFRASAGFGSGSFALENSDIKDYYVIPKLRNKKVDFMIEIDGSSMYPKYNSGDVVACTVIQESAYIQWNKTHVIATKHNHLFFDMGKRLLISRMLTGQFPNYEAVLPRGNDRSFTINRDEITAAVKRVAILSDERSHTVKLSVSAGSLEITASHSDLGEAHETLDISYTKEDLQVGFNHQYLIDFLTTSDDPEVSFEFKDSESAAQLRGQPASDYNYRYVVMPMRI